MSHGGSRRGAGRKSNAELQKIRAILDSVVSEQDWRQLFESLLNYARQGDMRAAQILISYRYGIAGAAPNAEDLKQIQFIEVPRPPEHIARTLAKSEK